MPDHKVKPPLLFISQNSESNPSAKAQSYFYSNNENVIDIEPKEEEKKESVASKRRKFQDMSVEERLRYMVDMPSILPKMKCEVQTDNNKYIGTIEKCDEDILMLRTVDQGFRVKIKRGDIEDVQLVGF
ncbi:CotO family spore coat protein [Alkalibacillus haloalkaliphilus]|uniref:CotO family spore coat protein n=1 Tax=Alkalibacillus haloalkaliphilus TaxID=94136 RepID=UPI002935E6AB|nr:CotO family spore coat protein [Alkalibacillus haloalkaliphilus]MDV2582720.1 CotO family spore coat protein [Alkalibacillus haloalkaliphilus]